MSRIKQILVIPNSDDLNCLTSFYTIAIRLIEEHEESIEFGKELIVSFFNTETNSNFDVFFGRIRKCIISMRNEDFCGEKTHGQRIKRYKWETILTIDRNCNFSLFSDLKIGDQFDFQGDVFIKKTEIKAEYIYGYQTKVFNGQEKVFLTETPCKQPILEFYWDEDEYH